MTQTCPTCGKPVDPLRARSVGVRDGKVVAYCTTACAAAGESQPTKVPARTPATGIPSGKTPSLESGPVITIVRESVTAPLVPTVEPANTSLTRPERDDTTLHKWTVEEDAGAALDDNTPRKTSRKVPMILVGVLALGVSAVWMLYRGEDAEIESPTPAHDVAADKVAPAQLPEPARPDRNTAVARARKVLQANMASPSPRVQRVAAAALARTKDAAALEMLAKELSEEKLDVGKLDLGYWLARGGDQRGRAALVAGLGSGRRDVKLQAGRLLAQLGDARAAGTLAAYLDVQQTRLGTAEYLAALEDERAIKALDAVRADAKTSADDRARATIALGIAGRRDVIPDLQVLLQDSNFKKFAASALAQLGEPTARAVLAEELSFPSLRVEAARSLRVLEPGLDPAPFLPELMSALESNKDTEQVQVAEAILLLAGDAAWSERW